MQAADFEKLFNISPAPMCAARPDGTFIQVNPALADFLGMAAHDLAGRLFTHFVHPDDRESTAEAVRCLGLGQNISGFSNRLRAADGDYRTLRWQAIPDGERVLAAALDITEDARKTEQLRYLRTHDPLTGLPNRTGLEQALSDRLAGSAEAPGTLALFLLDLRTFRDVNEAYGFAEGDNVLCGLAERLQYCAGNDAVVARLSGDVFAVATPVTGDHDKLLECANRLLRCVEEPVHTSSGDPVQLSARVGAASAALTDYLPQELVADAQTALNQVKRDSEIIGIHQRPSGNDARGRGPLMAALHTAVARRGFQLAYQPQVQLSTGRMVGAEVLLRWQLNGHPVPTNEFIPLLDESGLMLPVGRWVIETVCAQWKAWHQAGYAPIRLSVNLAPSQVRDPELLPFLRRCLQESGMPPSALQFEITENVFLSRIEQHLETMRQLRDLGVGLALDDFGTGYSSLSYLRHFPVDTIKIDQSFIQQVTSSPGEAAITRAIISMAEALDLKVVAEGAETAAQIGFLRQHGCDVVQGYYFDRPLDPRELERKLINPQVRPAPAPEELGDQGTLLIVDDEEGVRNALRRLFRRDGYRLLLAANAEEALELMALNQVDVVLSDQRMPGTSGTELLSALRHMYPETVRMVISGYTDVTSVTEAVNSGSIYKFISKPWDDEQLRGYIAEAFRVRRQAG
ncbi:MAG: EAL domain-containing protein [Ectothiorhodospiraceae bacterium]|nr:EAL domain-containing protein [Ectothiorhodospiraceae bacterium]